MTERASRKRRADKASPAKVQTPQKPAENEGRPRAGDKPALGGVGVARVARGEDPTAGLKSGAAIAAFHMGPTDAVDGVLREMEGREGWLLPNRANLDALAEELSGVPSHVVPTLAGNTDSAPYQLPDGSWEVMVLDANGRVHGRRAVEGPQ